MKVTGMPYKEYMELQKEWYKKLKEDGFEDIELVYSNKNDKFYTTTDKNNASFNLYNRLKSMGNSRAQLVCTQYQHFDLLLEALNSGKYERLPRIHKTIIELYATGHSYRSIQNIFRAIYTIALAKSMKRNHRLYLWSALKPTTSRFSYCWIRTQVDRFRAHVAKNHIPVNTPEIDLTYLGVHKDGQHKPIKE